jgi:transcriptional regulator with XRE-family HTH domain
MELDKLVFEEYAKEQQFPQWQIAFVIRANELITEKDIKKNQLSKKMNFVDSAVSNFIKEKPKQRPTLDTVYNIAEIFNVSIDYLLGRTDFKTGQFHKNERRFLEKYGLTPEILNAFKLIAEHSKKGEDYSFEEYDIDIERIANIVDETFRPAHISRSTEVTEMKMISHTIDNENVMNEK